MVLIWRQSLPELDIGLLSRTAAQQAAVSQQGGWDMSRPPPNLSQPPPHLMEPKIPSLPYFELPAGGPPDL